MTQTAGSIGIGLTITADDLTARITAAVKSAMDGVMKEVKTSVGEVDKALGNIDASGLDVVSRAAESVASAVDGAASSSTAAAGALDSTSAAAAATASALDGAARATSAARDESGRFASAAQDAAKATQNTGDAAREGADRQGLFGRALGAVRGSLKDFATSTAEAVREQAKLNAEAEKGPGLLSKLGGAVGGAAGKVAKMTGVVAGLVGLGGIGTILTKGLNRLTAIDDAKAKLDGLGHSAESVDEIMSSALAGVKGTAYGLGDAASAAASAVASGIKPGADLERTIKLMGDAASIAGVDLNSMAGIFNKVAATGKVSGREMAQLASAGIPALQLLGDELGKTAEEVNKMVSAGEVDFETFQNAIEKGMGGAALTAGMTFSGAVDNMGASLGRLGAAILDAPFKAAPGLIGGATAAVDGLTDKVAALSKLLFDGEFTEGFAKAFNVEEDSGLVDKLFNIREGVLGVKAGIDLFVSGDYNGKIGEALGVDEDSQLVDRILTVREMVIDWGAQIGRIFGHVKDLVTGVIGPLGEIAGSLGKASAAIGISAWTVLLDILEMLVPILSSMLIPALQTLADFMNDNQALVTVLVGAYTAWKLVMMGLNTYIKVAAVGLKAWSAITKAGAAIQAAFNAVMAVNPFILLGIAVAALVTGLVLFFTKTETGKKIFESFKNAVVGAFDAIKRAFSVAIDFIADNWKLIVSILLGPLGVVITQVITHWDKIKAIFIGAFEAIGAAISWAWENVISPVWEGIKTAASLLAAVVLTVLITPFILAWELLSAAISFAWETIIKPIFEMWGAVATWLWENAIKPAWEGIKAGISWVGDAFTWLWNNAVKPAMDGIGAAISWVYTNVITPTFNFIKAAIDAVGKVFTWLWNNAVKPAWDGIGNAISFAWNNVILPVFDILKQGVTSIGDAAKWLWENAIKPAWDGIGNVISSVWENVISPAWEAMKSALGSVGDFFDTVVGGIKSVWEGLKKILAAPINFLINTVYNDGILKAWNAVAKFLPVDEGSPISGIPEHYTGGRIDGPGGRDNVLMWGTKDEHMLTVDEVQALGGHNLVYAMRDLISRGIPFEWDNGSLVPKLGLQNMERYGAAVQNAGIGNVPTEGLFEPLLRNLPGHATGGKIEANEPWVDQLIRAHEFARSQSGKPYQWAGPTGMGSSFDCSGFMGSIAATIQGTDPWQRYWATGSFPGSPQGFAPGLSQGFSIGVFNGGPYGGHTAGTLSAAGNFGAVNVESGGSPSAVKYDVGAAGADHSQFTMQYHLPIGANGMFEASGGPSPEEQRSWLIEKAAGIINGILDPIKDGYRGLPFVGEGQFFDVPPAALDKGRDAALDAMEAVVGGLGAALGSVWNGAKNLAGSALDTVGGVLSAANPMNWFDSGGVARGVGMMPKNVITPERVLSPRQTVAFETLVEALDRLSMPTAAAASSGLLDKATFESGLASLANAVGLGKAPEDLRPVKGETMAELGDGIDAQGRILSDTKTLIERTETSRAKVDQMRHDQIKAIFDDIVGRLGDDVFVPMVKAGMSEAFGSDPAVAWGKAVSDDIVAGISNALAMQQATAGLDLSGLLGMFTGGGAAFDSGGLARGLGMMPKATIEPERVLSPSQTRAFEAAMGRGFAPTGIMDGGGIGGTLLRAFAELVGVQIAALNLINAVAKDIRSFKGTSEAAYDANGRLISDTSALLERTETSMQLVEDNNRKIMQDMIVGTLRTLIESVLIPAVTAVLSGLITAATTAIGTAIAGPVGGIIGAVAGAALSGLAGLATSFIGKGLSALVGNLFDEGGVAEGMGIMHKGTIKPERVLSPRQTSAFERLVDALEGGASASRVTINAPFTVKGDHRGGQVVHNRMLSLLNS